jgi:hypothetical protein
VLEVEMAWGLEDDTSNGRQAASDKSMAELGGDLARQMTALVHHEIELAKAEMTMKGRQAGKGAGMFGAAGVAAGLGLACLTACVIAALQLVMPVWAAALIVGFAYVLVAGVIALMGRSQLAEATPPVPAQAMQSTKEDVEWLKIQAKSGRR